LKGTTLNAKTLYFILFSLISLPSFHVAGQRKTTHLSRKKQIEQLNIKLRIQQDSIRNIQFDVYDLLNQSLKLQKQKDSLLDKIISTNSKKSLIRIDEITVFNSLKIKEESEKDSFFWGESPSNSKIWMAMDLNVTTFRNGDTLFHAQSSEQWKYAFDNNIPAYCLVDNNSSNGILYNWMAVNDSRGLAPYNWHIPTKNEFLLLNSSGVELKSTGGWGNAYCMNMMATGMRDAFSAYYWTAEVGSSLNSWVFVLQKDYTKGTLTEERRENGYSVRCVKDMSSIEIGGSGEGKFEPDKGNIGVKRISDPKNRIRLNDPIIDNIEVDRTVRICLQMTIDENGQIISARSTSKTTTNDQKIINRVIDEVKKQVRYSKDPNTDHTTVYFTIHVEPG
jgi:hypothetical protein